MSRQPAHCRSVTPQPTSPVCASRYVQTLLRQHTFKRAPLICPPCDDSCGALTPSRPSPIPARQNMVVLHLRELERSGGATRALLGAPVAGLPQAELLAWYLDQQAARHAPAPIPPRMPVGLPQPPDLKVMTVLAVYVKQRLPPAGQHGGPTGPQRGPA